MIRILYLLGKPASMRQQQFEKECAIHYDMSHGIPGLYKYEVRLIANEPTDVHVPFFEVTDVAAIGECWFENETEYQRYLDSDIRKAWFEHGKSFIGKLKPFVTREIN